MNEILLADPAAAMKWLAILVAFIALYTRVRKWETTLTGKIEKIEVAQPLTITEAHPPVSRSEIEPLAARITRLEREVNVMADRMARDKDEILTKLSKLQQSNTDGFRSLERAIGRLEGGKLT